MNDVECENGKRMCFPNLQELQLEETCELQVIDLFVLRRLKIGAPGCPRRSCQRAGGKATQTEAGCELAVGVAKG